MFTALALALVLQSPNQWIWAEGDPIPSNVYFRQVVTLAEEPTFAKFNLTCDDAYEFYVNGEKASSSNSWYLMRTVDLKNRLHKGRNILAIAGRNVGSEAGLLVDGTINTKYTSTYIETNPGWKVSTKAESGWNKLDFDDSGWVEAKVVGYEGCKPWGNVVREGTVVNELKAIRIAKPTAKRPRASASPDLSEGFTWPKDMTGIKGKYVRLPLPFASMNAKIGETISKPRSFRVDFGREVAGWVEIELTGPESPDVKIQVGEFLTPQSNFPTSAERIGNKTIYRLLPTGSFTGFRFAWIDLSNVTAPVKLTRVEAIWRMFPANYVGSFECSDKLLNQIWHVGAYSAHMNLDPVAFSAILRPERGDRFPWMGDDRVTARTVLNVFGNYDHVKADLDYYVAPGQKEIVLDNIPGYTLDWVIALYTYWMHSGDDQMVRKHLADIKTILKSLDTEGTPPGWLFTDWEPDLQTTSDESVLAFHFKYVHAARVAVTMAQALKATAFADEFDRLGESRAAFVQGQMSNLRQHSLTNALLAGFKLDYPSTMRGHTDTPYFSNYSLEALSKAGQDGKALSAIRSYWGGMIKLGATSTWEYFLPEWTAQLKPLQQPPDVTLPNVGTFFVSLCHPWSTGATPWLSEHVLGVTPLTPGFAECEIRPFFGDLKWAKGSVPTPKGPVKVSWSRKSGLLKVQLQVPIGVKANLILPSKFSYRVDGKFGMSYPEQSGSVWIRFIDSKPHIITQMKD